MRSWLSKKDSASVLCGLVTVNASKCTMLAAACLPQNTTMLFMRCVIKFQGFHFGSCGEKVLKCNRLNRDFAGHRMQRRKVNKKIRKYLLNYSQVPQFKKIISCSVDTYIVYIG